jgi:hypothetical protein
VLAPCGLCNPACGVAKTPAVNEQLLVGIQDRSLFAVLPFESLNHSSHCHAGKQPQPFEESLALRGLGALIGAADAQNVRRPFRQARGAGPGVVAENRTFHRPRLRTNARGANQQQRRQSSLSHYSVTFQSFEGGAFR